VGADCARQLVDGGAACGKIRHHLRGHFRRIGRHVLPGHAVIAGEHEDFHALQARRRSALPVREPGGKVFEPAKATRRLGQHRFARRHRRARGMMTRRQVEAKFAQLRIRGKIGH
jgi:hypothetical protein